MRKIIVACDSFKGSLGSEQVANAVEEGIRGAFPDCEVCKVSIADGGEGTVGSLMRMRQGYWTQTEACDPLMRPVTVRYGIADCGRTAIIEMAAASGLTLLACEERDPMKTSTYGTGQVIADAFRKGCRQFIVGIGGSATNDGGTGMLRALGFRFLDAAGRELCGGGEILPRIVSIDPAGAAEIVGKAAFTVACDVTNPLTGPDGASRVFAAQKGATPQMVDVLDEGLRNFARVVRKFNGADVEYYPGAGAAGGLGAGFKALLGAELKPGIDLVLEAIGFDRLLEHCDLVITGEGRIDSQTASGKAPAGVLKAARRKGVPVVAIAGEVERSFELNEQGFAAVFSIQPGPESLQEAMRPERTAQNITTTVRQMMNLVRQFHYR